MRGMSLHKSSGFEGYDIGKHIHEPLNRCHVHERMKLNEALKGEYPTVPMCQMPRRTSL